MYTNISNVIDGVIKIIEKNVEPINEYIREYQSDSCLHIFKGMRATLPVSSYPSLELEPTSGSNEWVATRMQSPTYNIEFTLTVSCSKEEMSVEYIGGLSRLILQLLNNPRNMSFVIPLETSSNIYGEYVETRIQDAFVDNVTYNAVDSGTIRVAQWEWYCKVLEGFPTSSYETSDDESVIYLPHPLPPIE